MSLKLTVTALCTSSLPNSLYTFYFHLFFNVFSGDDYEENDYMCQAVGAFTVMHSEPCMALERNTTDT